MTVSDRAARGEYEDRSGPAVVAYLERTLEPPWEPRPALVPDEGDQIQSALTSLADAENCDLVLTTGGTGPAPNG